MDNTIDLVWASDHRGLELKEKLMEWICPINSDNEGPFPIAVMRDTGTYTSARCDYPNEVKKFADEFSIYTHGILICGSGFGVSIAANRFKDIRALPCRTIKEVRMACKHNNMNVLCLGSDFTTFSNAKRLIKAFFETEFEKGRHQNRVNMLKELIND